jgi:peptidoglycan/xylan/chitin deacetylase (PgdA/CDA1 family)
VLRVRVKRALAALATGGKPSGATLLTYHRIGGGTGDELDLPVAEFADQLDVLVEGGHDVVALDQALDRLDAGDDRPSVVLTFDDGFREVYAHAFPLLGERQLPFTLYLTAGLVDAQMRWEGSSASSQGAAALSWDQVLELHAGGLCTIGNHTWDHAGPDTVDVAQLDRCSDLIERRVGLRPAHFAWTWGVPVPALLPAVAERFRSAATGELGRNSPSGDRWALRRVPVRASDPIAFFRAKLVGDLAPERAYASVVRSAKVARRLVPGGRSHG